MKKVILLTLLSLTTGLITKAQTISFEQETIDYGTVAKGASGLRVFSITNTGDKPLILKKVEPSCGCTSPSWPKTPIMPGKKAQIKVTYDTNKVGAFSKTITVFSNALETKRKILTIKGEVKG